jgi:hypothetical protein
MTKLTFSFPQIAGTIMFLVLFIQTCGIKREIRNFDKRMDELEKRVKVIEARAMKTPTTDEVKLLLKKNMYESLVIEEDVDKGVISISEIKKKKLENED